MAMGVAEVIPGISGGTIALILGVYERLIKAISCFDYNLLLLLKDRKILLSWMKIDGNFLFILLLGMLLSIYSLSSVILFLMQAHPLAFKSFLSSLLFCSAFVEPLRPKISKQFFLGIIISMLICSLLYLIPAKEIEEISPLYLLFSGFLAVTALVVPGISGSFILLLLGTYSLILQAVRDFELGLLLIFITGAIMGLLSSARAIKYLYEKKKDLLLSIFFGLIIFCIPLIWQEQSITNILEGNSQPLLVGLILGILTVLSFTYLDRRS